MARAQPKKARVVVAPETLPPRPILKQNTYASAGEAYSLDDVAITYGTAKAKKNTYLAPTGNDKRAETLQDYLLVLSRYQLPAKEKYSKQWHIQETAIEAVNRIVANLRYIHVFGEDPTVGTTQVELLTNVLASGTASIAAYHKAYQYMGTKAYIKITDALSEFGNHEAAEAMLEIQDEIYRCFYGKSWLDGMSKINSSFSYHRKDALRYFKAAAERLERYADSARDIDRERAEYEETSGQDGDEDNSPYKAYPKDSTLHGEWEQLVVSKPELAVNHTGKLGRRSIAADSGREPHFINRIATDPDKRIFKRKTRALGAVVVIDCSGSMSLSEDDIDRLLKASTGATVLLYSGGHNNPEVPNCWVIARKGRMARKLPKFPGANAVDGPALLYGCQLRNGSQQPIIWVCDGHVTGIGDNCYENLQDDIDKIKRRYHIHQVRTVPEAEKLMKQLQGRS